MVVLLKLMETSVSCFAFFLRLDILSRLNDGHRVLWPVNKRAPSGISLFTRSLRFLGLHLLASLSLLYLALLSKDKWLPLPTLLPVFLLWLFSSLGLREHLRAPGLLPELALCSLLSLSFSLLLSLAGSFLSRLLLLSLFLFQLPAQLLPRQLLLLLKSLQSLLSSTDSLGLEHFLLAADGLLFARLRLLPLEGGDVAILLVDLIHLQVLFDLQLIEFKLHAYLSHFFSLNNTSFCERAYLENGNVRETELHLGCHVGLLLDAQGLLLDGLILFFLLLRLNLDGLRGRNLCVLLLIAIII